MGPLVVMQISTKKKKEQMVFATRKPTQQRS